MKIIIALAALAVGFFVVIFVASFINIIIGGIIKHVFYPLRAGLDSWCEDAEATSNPLGILTVIGIAGIFYNVDKILNGNISEFWGTKHLGGFANHQLAAFGILAVLILYSILRYRLRLFQVTAAKLLRIPLMILYLPFGLVYFITSIFAGGSVNMDEEREVDFDGSPIAYTGGGGSGYRPGRTIYASTSDSTTGGGTYSEAYYQPTGETGGSGSDGFSYLGDHHNKENAEQQGGSSGYYYTSSSDSTQYYGGDYRPYNEDGTTTEVYHLDEGCSPMDN